MHRGRPVAVMVRVILPWAILKYLHSTGELTVRIISSNEPFTGNILKLL